MKIRQSFYRKSLSFGLCAALEHARELGDVDLAVLDLGVVDEGVHVPVGERVAHRGQDVAEIVRPDEA